MQLTFKALFTPIGRDKVQIDVSADAPIQTFVVGADRVSISRGQHQFEVMRTIEVPDDKLTYFQDTAKALPPDQTIEAIVYSMGEVMTKTLRYLKYLYRIPEIDEELRFRREVSWTLDGQQFFPFPDKRPVSWRGTGIVYTLPDPLLAWIPRLIEEGVEPFFGYLHLHKAFSEENTRHQWINATVAAELAFKEFLCKFERRASTLILKVPSPPLKTLYKDVLMEFTGQASPVYKEIQKGVERRNELIHQPGSEPPSKKDTINYLNTIEVAITHLMTLLYPNHQFVSYIYRLSEERAKRQAA